ncbi:AsmA family protein, partial [Acetobacter pomorum]
MVGLPLVGTVLLFARMALGPINVTPLVRPFLPVTVISGGKKQPPVATLGLGRAYLEWNGLRDGLTSPLMLALHDIAIKGPDRTVVDTVHEAHVTVDTFALLHGGIALRAVELEGVQLALRRSKNGAVGFDFETPPNSGGQSNTSVDTAGMDRAVISHAVIQMNDQLTGTHWVASPLDATLHMASAQGKKGLTGAVQFAVTGQENPDCHIEVKASGRPDSNGKGIVWHLATNAVRPASFSNISHDLQHIRVPIAVSTDVSFLPAPNADWLLPGAMELHADAQSGKVTAAGARYFLNNGTANITLRLDHLKNGSTPAHIIVHSINANLRNPDHPEDVARGLDLTVSGQVDASDLVNPTTVSGQVVTDIPQVYFPDLVYYWPDKAAKGGKKWVTKNITDGIATNLHTTVTLSSTTGWNGVDVSNISGGLDAKGLTIYWLRPISPLRGMDAHMDVDGLDKLSITFDHGYQLVDRAGKNVGENGTGRIAAGPGSMDIVGLTKKDQTGIINTQLDGKLQDVMALLAEPRLHLLARHPLDIRNPRGRAKLQLMLSLPLKDDVSIDDMEIKGHADITQASLDNVVAGRGVRRADIKLDATADGLSLAGHGVLGGLPSNISYSTDFRHVPPTGLLEQAHLTSRITPQTAAAAGFATGDHFGGSADAVVDYRQYGDHHGLVDINLNLRNSQIRIPLWHKAPGRAAQANATLGLQNGQIVAVDRILATGPDLDVRGKARLRPHHAPQLIISSFRVAHSTGHAMLELPQKGIGGSVVHVGVYADMLDLSPLVMGDPS